MGFQGYLFAQLDHLNDYEATYPSAGTWRSGQGESHPGPESPQKCPIPTSRTPRHPLGRRGTPMDKRPWSRGRDGWRGLKLFGQLEGEDVSRLDMEHDQPG